MPIIRRLSARHGGRYHIGIGRTHVLLLIQDLHIPVINAATGELLRETLIVGSGSFRCPETSQGSRDRIRTYNLPANRRSITPEMAGVMNVVNPPDLHRGLSGAYAAILAAVLACAG